MLKVLTLLSNFPMRRSDCLDRLFPAMASAFLSGQRCLQLFQFLLCLAIVTRVVEKIASGKRGKMGDSQVNAHILIAHGQCFGLADLAGKASVPVLSFAFDRQGFDRACQVSMQMQFDGSDFGEMQIDPDHPFFALRTLVCIEFPACSIRVSETVVPVASLKSGIARFLSVPHPTKEGSERFL